MAHLVEAPRQPAMDIELLGFDRPGLVHERASLDGDPQAAPRPLPCPGT